MRFVPHVTTLLPILQIVSASGVLVEHVQHEGLVANAMKNLQNVQRLLHINHPHPHPPSKSGKKGSKKGGNVNPPSPPVTPSAPSRPSRPSRPTRPSRPSRPNRPSAPRPTPVYDSGVYDNYNFRFPLKHTGKMQPCSWLTEMPSAVDQRRDAYCVDMEIVESCPISCGTRSVDDPNFTFPLNFNGERKSCSWLTTNDEALDERRKRYCGDIGPYCPQSCGYHPYNLPPTATPTSAPVRSTPTGTGVYDNTKFVFPVQFNPEIKKSCKWITDDPARTKFRRETYCVDKIVSENCPISCGFNKYDDPDFTFPLNYNGSLQPCKWLKMNDQALNFRRDTYCDKIGTFCPESCGYHPYNNFPTSPTKPPVAAPKPTDCPPTVHTSAPTPVDGGVYDDVNFHFPVDATGAMQPCSWLTVNEEASHRRKEKYCVRPEIVESCPISCHTRRFDDPNFSFPLINDGTMQKCKWLTANADAMDHRRNMYCGDVGDMCPVSCGYHPYNIQVTSAPTIPTATIAPTPVDGGVYDDVDFHFRVDATGAKQSCSWLKYHRRKMKYCVRPEIVESCPISCATRRFDDPDFTFSLINDGTMQKCKWLTANADTMDHRRNTYCGDVGVMCPVSCGYHPYNIQVTAVPTMTPTPLSGGVYDDVDFHFPVDATGVMQPCSWLTINEEASHRRKEKYCVRPEIVESCPISCHTNRFDDPHFTFPLINDGTMQKCKWLTANADTMDRRRSMYCGDIGVICPVSCGYHPYNIQVTVIPTIAPTPASGGVYDNVDFHFPIDFDGSMKHCSWLTMTAIDRRRGKYCVRPEIVESCPISCGTRRFDDPDYTFPLINDGTMQKCSWLMANENAIIFRRNTYCSDVGTFCPVSCGYHPYDVKITSAPTATPTSALTPSDTGVYDDISFLFPIDFDGSMKPCNWLIVNEEASERRKEKYCARSEVVESCPISCGTRRLDNPNFAFPLINEDTMQKCSWLTANMDAIAHRRDTYCSDVGAFCPVSCGYHPYNTLTSSPTIAPTPSGTGVYDDVRFIFPIDFDGSMKPCTWIKGNERRKDKYCVRPDIFESCPISCGTRKFDDPHFTFPLQHNGEMEKCNWLTANEDAIEFRRNMYCDEIGDFCPVSCGFHPYNMQGTHAPTPFVTSAPTPSPPSVVGVFDDDDFRFPLIHDGSLQSCTWITTNPAALNYRRKTYCADENILGSCPISCGTNKYDDPDFTFPSKFNGAMQKCRWISGEYRRSMYCSDMNIANSCPESCGFHPYTTFPSPSPPINPGTAAPTPSTPSGDGVYDDDDYRFPLFHDGSMQSCSWITNNPAALNYRREAYCVDKNILGSCPISCGTNKYDDPAFTFPSTFNGSMQKCSWIAGEYRRSMNCGDMSIAASCPESCGFHPYNTFPSPAPPTQPPSPPTTIRPPVSPPVKSPKSPKASKGKGGKGKNSQKAPVPVPVPPAPVPVPPAPINSAITSGGTVDVQSIFAAMTTVVAAFALVFFA